MKITPHRPAVRPTDATPASTTTSTTTSTSMTLNTAQLDTTTTQPLGQSPVKTPVVQVPVEQRAGKTAALQALKQLPLGSTFAAIDLGSSSGKMLVGKVTAQGLQIVVDHKIGCALGRDVDAGQAIPAANMDRAIDALKTFVDLARSHGVDVAGMPLITTAVVRNAPNGQDFVARVQQEVGVAPRILSGLEEADIGFRGALGSLLQTPGRYATIDLGGGSFQLAVGTDKGLDDGGSTQMGSNTILDDMINPRVGADGVVGKDVFAAVDDTLRQVAPMPLPASAIEGRTLVATGGVSKFLRVHLGKDVIARDEIDALRRELGALAIPDRAAFVSTGRSDDEKAALGIGPSLEEKPALRFVAEAMSGGAGGETSPPEKASPGAQDYGKKLPASLSLLLHIVDSLGLDEVRVSQTDARHALLQMAVSATTTATTRA